jgi:hypothetical protein
MFQGAFELDCTVCPIAIKYNKIFVDAFWNSKKWVYSPTWCTFPDDVKWGLLKRVLLVSDKNVKFWFWWTLHIFKKISKRIKILGGEICVKEIRQVGDETALVSLGWTFLEYTTWTTCITVKVDLLVSFLCHYLLLKHRQSFTMHLVRLMTSWAVVCDVWYLEPQTLQPGETTIEFAER